MPPPGMTAAHLIPIRHDPEGPHPVKITGELTPGGLHRVARFDWESWIRRMPLPPELKLTALVMGTYASADGSNVRPGDDRLALDTGKSRRTVIRHRNELIERQLIERVRASRRNGRADEYALTIPAEALFDPAIRDPDGRPRLHAVPYLEHS